MGKNPYGCGPYGGGQAVCPKCGEITYEYLVSFSEGDEDFAYHHFLCGVCHHENERETYPDFQPVSLSPELEKMKEFKVALWNIYSSIGDLHKEMRLLYRSSKPTVKKEVD